MLTLILSSVIILALVGAALAYVYIYLRGNDTAEATGNASLDFQVFYLENDLFPENPIPKNYDYLMSFTDYIEVDSRFTARFSEITDARYNCTAVERLVIRHMSTSDSNKNPVVFEMSYDLSREQGGVTADKINYPAKGGSESYKIYPKDHIKLYMDFIELQNRQLESENHTVQNRRGFTAELFIDFTYDVSLPGWGINETMTQGYRLSISTESYSLTRTGSPNFSRSVVLNTVPQLTLPIIILYVALLSVSAYVLFNGIKNLRADPNERKQEALTILKKYANEIVVSEELLPLSEYTFMYVGEFESLLRLAINLNKHIMCYKDDEQIEFAVIVSDFAYYYQIDYFLNA
jgi:hypothetical protein